MNIGRDLSQSSAFIYNIGKHTNAVIYLVTDNSITAFHKS